MPQKPIRWLCLRNPSSGYASETHPVAMPHKPIHWPTHPVAVAFPQKPNLWPCFRNPSSGHAFETYRTVWPAASSIETSDRASETHPVAMPLKPIQWPIQWSNVFQWPYFVKYWPFVQCPSNHSAAKYLNMKYFDVCPKLLLSDVWSC